MKEDVVDEEEDLHRIKYKARAGDIFKIPNYLNEVLYNNYAQSVKHCMECLLQFNKFCDRIS